MNVSLSYPDFPYQVSFSYDRINELFAWDTNEAGAWLVERDGGPLLVTAISDDEYAVLEKPIGCFVDTCDFNVECLHQISKPHVYMGLDMPNVFASTVHFNFGNKDTAMLFKLTFGGAL